LFTKALGGKRLVKKIEYKYWLYDHEYENQGNFFDYISKLISEIPLRLNVMLLTSESNLIKQFESWKPSEFKVKINEKQISDIFTLDLEREGYLRTRVIIVRHESNPSIYYAISDCKSEEFNKVFTRFISKYFPDISKIFLTNNELYSIFSELERKGYDMMIESSIGKLRLEGAKKETQIRYTNKPYKELFHEINQGNQWIQNVRYRADHGVDEEGNPITLFKGTITRECYFAIKNNFNILVKEIIPHVLKLASVRNHHLKISTESASEPKPEPIVIKFDKNLFINVKKNESYLEALTSMPSCSISKYHNNPYVHASLVDYRDGSSYDLWILTENRLTIIPRFQASIGSVSRLVNHIFERIGDGNVEKYEELKQVTK